MPLSYLEGNPQDVYAIQRLGDTFSNALVGLAANRYRQQQFAAQQAMEQMQMQMEREKMQMQQPLIKAQVENYGADVSYRNAMAAQVKQQQQDAAMIGRLRGYSSSPLMMDMAQDPTTGPQMMGDLRAAGVVPQGQFQMSPEQLQQALRAALGASVYGSAAGTPAGAGRLADPLAVSRNQTLYDPFMGNILAQGGPGVKTPHEEALEEIARQRQALMDTPEERMKRVLFGNMLDVYKQPGMGTSEKERSVEAMGEIGGKFVKNRSAGTPGVDQSAERKAAVANELRRLHPDWPRQTIIDAVNKGVQ